MKKGPFFITDFQSFYKVYYFTKFFFAISKLKGNQILNFSNFFNIH